MTPTPTQNWPKPWLLQVHQQAVEQGFVWIEPISQEDADSFRHRFYRIRRRSDKSMAAFIPPEYHLVMVGEWEQGDGSGRLPIIYNKRADGRELPAIRSATGEEIAAYTAPPKLAEPVQMDTDSMDLSIKPEEIGGFIAGLRKSAKERQ